MMIKRISNIVIIILLLVATGGIPVTRHYCGSAEKSLSVFSTPKDCCNSHCAKCHNVFKFTKVNDNFEAGSTISAQSITELTTLHAAFFINLFDHLFTSPLPDLINQRKFHIAEAGHSPASFGNFRC